MLITTLGTSHGFNTPFNYYTSTLFETENGSYLVDAGCQVETRMIHLGCDVSRIKAIFITHPHHDHIGGIIGIIKDIRRTSSGAQPVKVYLPKDIEAPLKAWAQAMHYNFDDVEFVHFKKGLIYDDGSFKVEAFETGHLKHEGECVSFAFAINSEGKNILCSGDVTRVFYDLEEAVMARKYDLALIESTHYLFDNAADLLSKADIKRIIFNHIGDRCRGPLAEKAFMEILGNVDSEIEFALDGKSYVI